MVKECLKGEAFTSSSAIETALIKILNDLTFKEVGSVFHEWKKRLE
jgi:hypothetical protein